MPKQALIVKYNVIPEKLELFLDLLRSHIVATKATEPGCIQFDILIPSQGRNAVQVYEIYLDEDAFALHTASDQLAFYRVESNKLLIGREITHCEILE